MGLYDRDYYREAWKKRQAPRFGERNHKEAADSPDESTPRTNGPAHSEPSAIVRYGAWVLVLLLLTVCFDRFYPRQGADRQHSGREALQQHVVPSTPPALAPEEPSLGEPLPEPSPARAIAVPLTVPMQAPALAPPPAEPPKAPQIAELVLAPSADGSFLVRGQINQQEVVFLIDTGASLVSISDRMKGRLKLNRGRYLRTHTANGVVDNYATQIQSLTLGPLRFSNVPGALNPHASDDVVLLGMSVLKDLQLIHQEGRLILRQRINTQDRRDEPANGAIREELVMKRSLKECMGPDNLIDQRTLNCLKQ